MISLLDTGTVSLSERGGGEGEERGWEAHHRVAAGGDGGNVGQVGVLDFDAEGLQVLDQGGHRLLDAAGELDGVGARRHDLHALRYDGRRQNGGRRRAVSGCVVCL